ncbi:MAG: hypothetical protein LBM61_05360 [Prevotellaceae bacterium]|jgi:hypothetical protein|nr:hypothetical protein [Prevotellaceae bacterium]
MGQKQSKSYTKIYRSWKLGDFFRNFIAVVLGVAITFIGSDRIAERHTQSQVKAAMQFVKSELLLNKERIIAMQTNVQTDKLYAEVLIRYEHNLKDAPPDSIPYRNSRLQQFAVYTYIYDALDLLKTSSLVQSVRKPDLVLQILTAYRSIREADAGFLLTTQIKREGLQKVYDLPEVRKFDFSQSNAKVWAFLLSLSEGRNFLMNRINIYSSDTPFQETLDMIDETIAAIDKEYAL